VGDGDSEKEKRVKSYLDIHKKSLRPKNKELVSHDGQKGPTRGECSKKTKEGSA